MNQTIKDRIAKINNGQVPEGYEKTSFGIFPCDWEKDKEFGKLFDFYGGLGKSREELGDKGVCYLHYGDMHTNTFNKVTYEQYSHLPKYDIALKGNETYMMQDGDIAFLDASEDLKGTSRAVLIDNVDNKPFIAGLHTILAKEKQSVFSKYYKQYITLSQDVKKQFQKLAVGFKVYGLNRESIKKIKKSYPKTEQEQSRIAQILMQWDKTIELQEKYIASLENRKKALMQRLLTPKEGWKNKELGYYFDKEKGKNVEISYKGKFPIIDMDYTLNNEAKNFSNATNGVKANCDEIIILWDGASAGKVLYGVSGIVGSTFCVLRKTQQIESCYVFYYLDYVYEKNKKIREGSGIPHMPKDFLKKQIIYAPAKEEEQKIIANTLSQADQEISLQKQKLQKLIAQRKALMQVLLTGIVRV